MWMPTICGLLKLVHVKCARLIEEDYGQFAPKTTRTQDNSYPRQLVPRTIRTQDNSYPSTSCPGYELSWVRVVQIPIEEYNKEMVHPQLHDRAIRVDLLKYCFMGQ